LLFFDPSAPLCTRLIAVSFQPFANAKCNGVYLIQKL